MAANGRQWPPKKWKKEFDRFHGGIGREASELRKLGWTRRDLLKTPKGDRRKLKIARRVRDETAVTWQWLATRLHCGLWRHLANGLRPAAAQQR